MCADIGRLQRGHVVAPNRCSASRSTAIPQPGQCTLMPSAGRDGVMRWRRGDTGVFRARVAGGNASEDFGVGGRVREDDVHVDDVGVRPVDVVQADEREPGGAEVVGQVDQPALVDRPAVDAVQGAHLADHLGAVDDDVRVGMNGNGGMREQSARDEVSRNCFHIHLSLLRRSAAPRTRLG